MLFASSLMDGCSQHVPSLSQALSPDDEKDASIDAKVKKKA